MSTPERYRAVRKDGTPVDLDDLGGITPAELAAAVDPKADQADVDAALASVVSRVPGALSIDSRDGAGNPTQITDGGVVTTYTWNPDGTPATETSLGKKRTFTYDNGVLTGATVTNA